MVHCTQRCNKSFLVLEYRKTLILLLSLAGIFAACSLGHARAAEEPDDSQPKGTSWAILVGVEKYYTAPNLLYTLNDVQQLSDTLRRRGNYPTNQILEMVDTAPNARFQPLKASLMAELPRWLAKPAKEDSVLVYFSGHGFRGKDGTLYLAPLDYDPKDPASKGVSVQWLREQIAQCKAGLKLLILDACHAGSEKGNDDSAGVTAADLGRPFADLEGVVTLASSTGDEKSIIWDEMEQSLFSWWLNQGLKGHADANGDGKVTIDELYEFVHANVTATAQAKFHRPQTPVRIVRTGTPGVPVVVYLQPCTLREAMDELAEQLVTAARAQRLSRVGVAEFTATTLDPAALELLRSNPGLLSRWCALELDRRLVKKADSKLTVQPHDVVQKSLSNSGLWFKDLRTAAIRGLAADGQPIPVLAIGTVSVRTGRLMTFQCRLISTQNQKTFATANATASLNESEWAMLGRSVAVTSTDYSPEGQSPRPQLVERIDNRSNGPHPLADQNFPYRVQIKVKGEERKLVFKDNQCFVPLKKGDVYEIWLENRTDKPVLMRLLVDGLNTLLEKESTKGAEIHVIGKRVSLDEARPWVLDPADTDPRLKGIWAVRGFVTEIGAQGKLREFTVVDAQESLAARRQFTDQIGMITAAFYAPDDGASKGRGVGAAAGKEREESILYADKKLHCGNLLGVVHIRYVEPDELAKVPK